MIDIGIRQGKVWGYTTMLFQSQTVEVHYLEIKKGGYCSEHKHEKINIFHVLSGKLQIKIWNDDKLINSTILEAGQTTCAYKGLYHQFEALEDTKCIEIYQVFIQPDDIERRTEGGMR